MTNLSNFQNEISLFENLKSQLISENNSDAVVELEKVLNNYGAKILHGVNDLVTKVTNRYQFFYFEAEVPQDSNLLKKSDIYGKGLIKKIKAVAAVMPSYAKRMETITGETYVPKRESYYEPFLGSKLVWFLKRNPSQLYLQYEKLHEYMESKYYLGNEPISYKDIESAFKAYSSSGVVPVRKMKLENVRKLHVNGMVVEL